MRLKLIAILFLGISQLSNGAEAPVAPINIGAYNFKAHSAKLSFKDQSNNEDGFKVYYQNHEIANIPSKSGNNSYTYKTLEGLDACKLYTIKLVAYNSYGESNPLIKSFRTVGCTKNKLPIVDAGEDIVTVVNQTIHIVGSAYDSDGNITKYIWKEGNKVLSNSSSFNYTPKSIGTKIITLTAFDNSGDKSSDNRTIFVKKEDTTPSDRNTTFANIRDFGAIPNDNIDDTEAIKNALSESGAIFVPKGIYNVSNLEHFGTTIINGNGATFKAKRTVVGTSSNILKLKTINNSDKIEIKNLTFDGNCPTKYPRQGDDFVASLVHIYDSSNIMLNNIVVKDYSSKYYKQDIISDYERLNRNHSTEMFHDILITFSRNIKMINIVQQNIKIEGPLVYHSDNILIENFKSKKSINIWTALHAVADNNITMKHIDISDGLVGSRGSSINFTSNWDFVIEDVNTTHKHGFDISNEIPGVLTGRLNRDCSYGVFKNCRFEGYHPLQGYPTKTIHNNLKFINCKFIPSKVPNRPYAFRLEKSKNILIDNCTFGNPNISSRFNLIMGESDKLNIKNSKFINTAYSNPISSSIYLLGKKFGDIEISNNDFNGTNYTPVLLNIYSKDLKSLKLIDNSANSEEFEYGTFYKSLSKIDESKIISQ